MSDWFGNGGGGVPTQIGRFNGKLLNWMLVVGLTVTFKVAVVAHWPAFGVNV